MRLKKTPEIPVGYTRTQANEYSRIRLQVLISVFLCYSAYYLVRKDFVLVVPDLAAEGWSKQYLGLVMAVMTVSYGLSNLFMGFLADKVSIRRLMPVCLVVSACASLGLVWVTATSCSLILILILMFINGWMQGVGWPSSAKAIAHWFQKEERGRATSFWNLSNNLGAGLLGPLAILAVAVCSWWQCKLLFPAVLALTTAFVCWRWIRDRPEDCGLPPLQDTQEANHTEHEEEADKAESGLRGFVACCLKLPELWLLAILNVCVYFIRFGVIDWVPLYMIEKCGVSFEIASWAFTTFEFAAIPGTLLCGYVSDKLFKGRRVPVNLLNMSLVLLALLGYWQCSDEHWIVPILMLGIIGFLIYGCVVLLHVHIIDIAPRRYVAACVGFCGLFGYLFGASGANLVLGGVIDSWGWDGGFQLITSIGIVAVLILLLLWQMDNNRIRPDEQPVDKGKTEPSLNNGPVAERVIQV
ncbi:MFS transporter [Parendozoicomonas haliclonae]|uniref:Glycerol-3-phosphate transporter n=1 Tax=Parendozoicomonas haliclonae TaxID=1960125 RepID=A0A1X7ALX0_9GAMM|nr:MFS transporter [Parendozoicomonas haliclonae]SMA48599.1 Glycerol-3-phosphate transporter [Parendozoicomonas haliclonae]